MPFFTKRLSVAGSMPSAVSATMTCAQDSLFSLPQLTKPPVGSCAAERTSSALSTAARTFSSVS